MKLFILIRSKNHLNFFVSKLNILLILITEFCMHPYIFLYILEEDRQLNKEINKF